MERSANTSAILYGNREAKFREKLKLYRARHNFTRPIRAHLCQFIVSKKFRELGSGFPGLG
jgi:hypothetical protein